MEPIRVLHFFHELGRGGAESAIMNYYRHIDKKKVQFDFILTSPKHMDYEDEIAEMGGRVYRVPMLKAINPFSYLVGVKAFLKSHPEYKIVHSHTSSKSFFPLWMAKMVGVPIRISHSHSSQAEPGINGKIRLALRPLLKCVATEWLSCGEKAGDYLYGNNSINEKQYRVFRNVIESKLYSFNPEKRAIYRKMLGLEDDTFVIGHTARFDPVKNHKFDIELLVEIKKRNIKCKLLAIGRDVEEGITEYAKDREVFDDIIFTGVVDNVWDYEQAMDAFILPSFNEGLPLSIIEAQISGLPCFTTKGGVSEECKVTDLVEFIPLNVDEWADKIIECRNIKRIDRTDEIIKSGYDAATSANDLQHFYLSRLYK